MATTETRNVEAAARAPVKEKVERREGRMRSIRESVQAAVQPMTEHIGEPKNNDTAAPLVRRLWNLTAGSFGMAYNLVNILMLLALGFLAIKGIVYVILIATARM